MFLGKVAYEAYAEKAQGLSLISGDKLPLWEHVAPEIQEAWDAAALAVVAANH